jgi:hypothetical protein
MARCEYPHCFSLVGSASRLGEFAGVLTALTFSAIIFLAGRDKRDRTENTLILLFAAFVGMAIATYLFSGAASEERPGGRAAFETFCASLAFAAALLPLFLGVSQLMRDREFSNVALFAARLSNWVVAPVMFAFMSLTAVSARALYATEETAWLSVLGVSSGLLFAILLLWIFKGPLIPRIEEHLSRWVALPVGVVILASILSALWGERGSQATAPTAGYLVLIFVLFLATASFSSALKCIEVGARDDQAVLSLKRARCRPSVRDSVC